MVENVIRHLRSQSVPFRFVSHPSPGPAPAAALRSEGIRPIEAHVLRIDGRPAIAATAPEESVNLLRLQSDLGVGRVEIGSSADLPWPYTQASEPVPAIGSIFGAPLFLADSLPPSAFIAFCVFSPTDVIELLFDDYLRIEQPRVLSLSGAVALPATL